MVGGLVVLFGAQWFFRSTRTSPTLPKNGARANREQSSFAFHESYLDPANGKSSPRRTECKACHPTTSASAQGKSGFLDSRATLSQEAWAERIPLTAKCGGCHLVPHPSNLPRQSWREVMARMAQIMDARRIAKLTDAEFQDVLHFYFTFSPETQPPLADDPDPRDSPLKFERIILGHPASADPRERPFLGHVQIADLDKDGRLDVLVCDIEKSAVTWVHHRNGAWKEDILATVRNPAHTQL